MIGGVWLIDLGLNMFAVGFRRIRSFVSVSREVVSTSTSMHFLQNHGLFLQLLVSFFLSVHLLWKNVSHLSQAKAWSLGVDAAGLMYRWQELQEYMSPLRTVLLILLIFSEFDEI